MQKSVVGPTTSMKATMVLAGIELGWISTNPRMYSEMTFWIRIWHQLAFWWFTSFYSMRSAGKPICFLLAGVWLSKLTSGSKALIPPRNSPPADRQTTKVPYPRCSKKQSPALIFRLTIYSWLNSILCSGICSVPVNKKIFGLNS